MPIELVTGLPGNAKTLNTIGRVVERAAKENRAVYYSGLTGFDATSERLKGTQWFELADPKQWHVEVPPGAIIFIDECQEIFRNRSLGTKPELHVTELERHRHKGYDFYLITQHPGLIDPAIRKLTQTHHHLIRIFGMEASTVHTWNGVRETPEKTATRKDAQSVKWVFDKSLYGVYKSAEVHTVKRSIPRRVFFVLAAPVVVVACAVGFYFVWGKTQPASEVAKTAAPVQAPAGGSPVAAGGPQKIDFDPVQDARHYADMVTPRVVGLPHTAPKYDQLTVPTRVPVPAACIQIGTPGGSKPVTCKCMTQDATPMEVEFNMCIEFARNGYFQDFDPDRDRERSERSQRSAAVLAGPPSVDQGARAAAAAAESRPVVPSQFVAFASVPSPGGLGVNPPPNLNDGPPPRAERTVYAPDK